MADDPNKDGKQPSELDIIEGRAENLGEPVEVHLDEAGGKKTAADAGAKKPGAEEDQPDAAAKQTPKPDEDMESLRRQVASERQRREAAEARDRASKERIQRFETESQSHEASLIESNLRAAEHEKSLAKRGYMDAMQNGDPEKVADAIDRLTTASSRLSLYAEAKAELAGKRGRAHEGPVSPQEPRRRDTEADPVEAYVRNLAPRTADWIRSHPEFVTDPASNAKVMRAHHRALGEGHEEGSSEYFASIDNALSLSRRPEEQEPQRKSEETGAAQHQQAQEPQRRSQSAAAPVRGGGTSAGNGAGTRRTVTLTPQQREMADSMEISYQDYARNLVALESEGRIKRSVN